VEGDCDADGLSEGDSLLLGEALAEGLRLGDSDGLPALVVSSSIAYEQKPVSCAAS
jgi:hypothetical protein